MSKPASTPPSAGPRQRIELGAPVVLARLPLAGDPSLLLELVERGIERPVAHLEHVGGQVLEALADRPSVRGLERDDLEDEEIECALDEVLRPAHARLLSRLPRLIRPFLSVSKGTMTERRIDRATTGS